MIDPLGRRWFSVDSKSFEIKVEGEGRKAQVIITERRRGRSSWIRFREEGVRILLKGIESFRRETGKTSDGVEWWENGRRYRLESKENAAGRFIQCSVADEEGKKHRLFFPEGGGLVNGWTLLGEALQDMGFKVSKVEKRKPAKINILGKTENPTGDQTKNQSREGTRENGRQEALWLDISDYIVKGDLGALKDGVVGSWKSQTATTITSLEVEAWAKKAWRLKGSISFHPLNQNLFFMVFDLSAEADWVMENGSRICRGEAILLERWNPSTGCTRSRGQNQEAWVRVVGLPLHLWTEEILVTIRDSCGGFVAMDKETSLMKNLLWARILVKIKRLRRPTSVNLLAGARSYEIQLWWEIQPEVTEVYPRRLRRETKMAIPRVEDEGKLRAEGRVMTERGATRPIPKEVQRSMGQWQALHSRGTGGNSRQQLKDVGTYRDGSISQCEIQKFMGERRRDEEPVMPIVTSGHSPDLQYGAEVGQSPSGHHGVHVGPSPSQKRKNTRILEVPRLKDQKTKIAGMPREKFRETASPNFTKPHKSVTPGAEEEDDQKKRPSVNLGQTKGKTSKGDTSNKARRTSREERGSQTEGKEGPPHESDQDLNSGKATRDALLTVVSNIGGDEGVYCGGEKSLNPIGGDEGVSCEACRNPICREERSSASKREDEGDDNSQAEKTVDPEAEGLGKLAGTWPMSVCKARRSTPVLQEKEGVGSGQASSLVRGLATCVEPDLVVGRIQGMELGLGRPNFMDPGPKPNFTSSSHVVAFDGFTCSKAMEKGDGLRKEVQSRPSLQLKHKCSCSVSTEENVAHNWEVDENREDHS